MEVLIALAIVSCAVYIFAKNIKSKNSGCASSNCSKCTAACSRIKKR